jgi:hypothetical protein
MTTRHRLTPHGIPDTLSDNLTVVSRSELSHVAPEFPQYA